MIDINLLPYRQETSRRSILLLILLFCLLIGWSAFLLWTWISSSNHYHAVQVQVQKLDAQVNNRVKSNQQDTAVVNQDTTAKLVKEKTALYPIVVRLEDELPKGGTITDFQYQSGASITLQGTFSTLSTVSGYLKTLQDDPHFSQVKLTQMANLAVTGKSGQFGAAFTMVYHKMGGQG